MPNQRLILQRRDASFSMVEMLIVVGILGIIGVIAILIINPGELFAQARDANRITELQGISKAVQIYRALGGTNIGTPNVAYISLPDTSASCSNYQLPALPLGWAYHCVTQDTFRRMDGSGWIPINFTSISAGSPFATLPVDPVNSAEKNLYYIYVNGNVLDSYALAALLQSDKYLKSYAATDMGSDPSRFEEGTATSLWGQATGLVGYWPLDGSSADFSPTGNNGTIVGSPLWVPGKINQGLRFGGGNYITVPDNNALDLVNAGTLSAWVYQVTPTDYAGIIHKGVQAWSDEAYSLQFHQAGNGLAEVAIVDGNSIYVKADVGNIITNTWFLLTTTWDTSIMKFYVNGAEIANSATGGMIMKNSDGALQMGCQLPGQYCLEGIIDDARVYDRPLTAEEIAAGYNATK